MGTLLQVRIQYKGTKAGDMNRSILLSPEHAPGLDLEAILLSDLQTLKVTCRPKPEQMKFIRRSAQILFSWETDKDGTIHRTLDKEIRDAMKPKNRQVREDACIKYVKLELFDPTSSNSRKIHDHPKHNFRDESDGGGYLRKSASPARRMSRAEYSPKNHAVFESASLSVPLARKMQEELSQVRDATTVSPSLGSIMPSDASLANSRMTGSPSRVEVSNAIFPGNNTFHQAPPTSLSKYEITLSGLKHLQTVIDQNHVVPTIRAQLTNVADQKFTAPNAVLGSTATKFTTFGDPSSLIPQSNFVRIEPPLATNANTSSSTIRHTSASKPPTSDLTRELWDIRRQRTALIAREAYLVDALKEGDVASDKLLGQNPRISDSLSTIESEYLQAQLAAAEKSVMIAQKLMCSEQQKSAHQSQKLEISRERNASLRASLSESRLLLEMERQRRSLLESVVEDMEREMKAPFVVPELFEAMMKVAEIGHFAEKGVT